MSNTVLQQLGESFEQIGSDVVKQTVQAPKDIAQAAAESLGLSGSKKNAKHQQTPATQEEQKTQEEKRVIARAALEELSGKKKPKEKSLWEQMKEEEEQKKLMEKKRKEEAAKQALPKVTSKRPRGDLYGIKAKKASAEMSRNVRQD